MNINKIILTSLIALLIYIAGIQTAKLESSTNCSDYEFMSDSYVCCKNPGLDPDLCN